MRKFPCVFMRGGTSKGCMFLESDLPARDQWDDIFVQAMGSPDPKQIDGMGGCVSSNNKIVVVRKSDRPGIDVDYIVGQSIVGQSKIDYKSNCGNMTAATAPYAVEMGLVEDLTEPTTVVHMFNLNTNKTIDVEVPIKDGQFNNEGTCSIAGVDGTAGELKVNFLDPAGAKTGRLFPTGNAKEMLDLGELGTIEATILDVSNPMVLVRAADLGITGTQLPAEVGNDAPACLVSTSLLKLGLSAVLCIIFWFTAVQWSRWLLREYRGEAFWQSAWPLPTIYAAFLVFCMPLDPAVVLINRLMIISVLAVTISLLGIFLLLYEMYQVAREYTRSAQLDRENQLLAVESRRYTELRTYMEQTRHLRHDFRQHLHVIAGLTEAGQVDELKNYLHQYESELSEERPTLCANPAVDALAGHYDHEAHSLGVPVDWRLELPRQLAIPEADFCMMLGNLLENSFHASQKLPPEQRQVKVLARMLSPAMLGLLVENRYDGVLKRQQGILHSTKHDGMGIGLVSIQTAVSRYGGSMTVETENGLFRVNILLNL